MGAYRPKEDGMTLEFRVNGRIAKPVAEVFDAVVNPEKLSGYFTTIGETGWRENARGQKSSYMNCEGWSQMLACMKAYLEYGINLREGYYPSELKGVVASEQQDFV